MEMLSRTLSYGRLFLALICLNFIACSKDDDQPDSGTAQVMFINGFTDVSLMSLYVNDSLFTAAGFGLSSAYTNSSSGNKKFEAKETLTNTALVNKTFGISGARSYTVIAAGTKSNPDLLIKEDDLSISDSTKAYVRIINLASDSQPLTMSVSGGADLVNNVSYKSVSSFVSVQPSKYDVSVKSGATVVSTISNLNLLANRKYTILITGFVNLTPKATYNIIVNKI
jgi:hypothetical protein